MVISDTHHVQEKALSYKVFNLSRQHKRIYFEVGRECVLLISYVNASVHSAIAFSGDTKST